MAGDLTNMGAVSLMIKAAGMKELAATYTDEKIEKSFEEMGFPITAAGLAKEQRQELALAVDVNLLFKGRLKVMDLQAPLRRELAYHLLERMQAFRKSDRTYVGYVTEPDIVSRMCNRWEQAQMQPVASAALEPVMNNAVRRRIISGYQIKRRRDMGCFDPQLKIAYSHSNIKHIKQLIGLLMSETLQAKLQIEPKRSSFFYLPEWEKTADLHLEILDGGAAVAHKDEFDMVLEFTSPAHRDRFRRVIDAYAKREYRVERKVLCESWYQPLFRSDIPLEGYNRVTNIMIRDRTHVIEAYAREDEAETKATWFREEFGDLEVATVPIWVNDAFFRYLNGDYD
ncbi:MAG: hypothetical protein V1766_09315 [Pseudomonadota bacterium]